MKTQEYLITFKNNATSELIDMFYINATDENNAQQIANELTHEYENETYFNITASVELA